MTRIDSQNTLQSPFENIFAAKRILICVGSGGVGKTTTAASMALRAALAGHRTLVLTIDPAKRLANSLGLVELGHDVQQVDEALLDELAKRRGEVRPASGELHAMMLDQKRAFDELVEQHAKNPEAVKRILKNPVYQQISGSLAGSQEYAAMAKLHDFDEQGEFDVIVVDTPPTSHALDFLDAPRKLTEAIDSPAIEWFRKMQSAKGGGWSVVGRTGNYVLKRLSKFVGSQFIDDLAVFFTEFNDILGGFHTRAQETFATLRQDKVGFVLVACPESMAVREATFFYKRLESARLPFSGFVINRVHTSRPAATSEAELVSLLAEHAGVAELGLTDSGLRIAADAMLESHRNLQALAEADRGAIDTLKGLSEQLVTVPFLDQDVHQLSELARLGDFLFSETS